MHILLKKKQFLLCCEKNKIERKLIFIESLIFFFFFFLLIFLTFKPKKHFLQKFTPSNTRQIKFVNFQKRLTQFCRKICKNQCFSGCDDTLMTYINFSVHGHIREFIKETVSCNYYQFCTDATMVSGKFKEEVKTNNFQ